MEISRKNRILNNLDRGKLVLFKGKLYKFVRVESYVRSRPNSFLLEEVYTGYTIVLNRFQLTEESQILEEGSKQHKSIMVLYGS